MIYFKKINLFEGIDVNNKSKSKECDICHYWYFLNKDFKFPPNVFSGFNDLLIMYR